MIPQRLKPSRSGIERAPLSVRHISQLRQLAERPGLWSGCHPSTTADGDLAMFIAHGLIRWRDDGRGGYEITAAGRHEINALRTCPHCGGGLP